jgi:hypothetical protein
MSSLAAGQTFNITASTPGNGDISVDDTSTVTFIFNEALDIDLNDPESSGFAYIYFPDNLDVGLATLNSDSTSISFEVIHPEEMDVTWTVFSAVSKSGKMLDEPYVLNYTTLDSDGIGSVAGSILPDAQLGTTYTKGSVVYLFKENPFVFDDESDDGPELSIAGAALVDAQSGSYTISGVRPGTYLPLALNLLFDSFDQAPDKIAIYDSDMNGELESVTVNDNDLSGIDLTYFGYSDNTAADNLQRVGEIAASVNTNLSLYIIGGYNQIFEFDGDIVSFKRTKALNEADPIDGTAPTWSYLFHSPQDDLSLIIDYGPFGTLQADTLTLQELIEEIDIPGFNFAEIDPLPASFIDSDSAAAVAEANGGAEFRNNELLTFRYLEVEFIASNANFLNPGIVNEGDYYWIVNYERESFDPLSLQFKQDELYVYVDMLTGAFLGSELNLSEPFLLKDGAEDAINFAYDRDPSNQLIFVNGYAILETAIEFENTGEVQVDDKPALQGAFSGYEYRFYSTTGDSTLSVYRDQNNEVYETEFDLFDFIPDPYTVTDLAPIDTATIIDSDEAMSIALAAGGEAFLNSPVNGQLLQSDLSIQLGNFDWYLQGQADMDKVIYAVYFNRRSLPLTGGVFEEGGDIVLDAVTGDIIGGMLVSNETDPEIAEKVILEQNYPNPFNPSTTIGFEIGKAQHVELLVYNILGQKVATLSNQRYAAGFYTLQWDASDFSSGIYIYQLRTENSVINRKMMLIK